MKPLIHINEFNCRITGETDTHYLVRVLGDRKRELPDYFEDVSLPEGEIAQNARLRKDHPDIQPIDWTKRRIHYKGYVLYCYKTIGNSHFIWDCPNSPLPRDLLDEMEFSGRLEYRGKISVDDPEIEKIEDIEDPTTT